MLFFIGGAARTGKGILARRLLAEAGLPYLSLDVLKMGLARGAAEYPLDPNAGAMCVAERLWPIVREMSRSLIVDGTPYLFEGELLPTHVAALRAAYPADVYGCFLGYAEVAPQQKLNEIRAHAGHPNDWPREYGDADLLAIVTREIAFSQHVRAACRALDLPYFDTSQHFETTLDGAAAAIRAIMQR